MMTSGSLPLESCICVTFINEISLCSLGGLNDTRTLRLKVMKGFWLNMAFMLFSTKV